MQMVGVEQDMPGANRTPRERFAERLRCRNMIRVRIHGLMRCDDDLRAEFVDQCLQVGQQVVPGRGAVDIAWQRFVVPAARSADISVGGRGQTRSSNQHRKEVGVVGPSVAADLDLSRRRAYRRAAA